MNSDKMNALWKKVNNITGNKLFFVGYLFFFAVAIFLCANADVLFPEKVIDTSGYRPVKACEYPLIRLCLIGVAVVHFAGGVAFFVKLCFKKLDW